METNPEKITEWFEQKARDEFHELWDLMDIDYDIWAMNPTPKKTGYDAGIYTKTKGHESDIVVTSNDLRVFSDKVCSTLASSEMQIMISMAVAEGEDKREDIGKLERLLYFAFNSADERLRRLLLPPLRESGDWCAAVRGWRAGRFLVEQRGKDVIFNFTNWDPRWLGYEVGDNGLTKVGYKTFKSKESLGRWHFGATKKTNEFIEYWEYEDEEKIGNALVCDNKLVKEAEVLKIPSMPIVIMPVATRPPIASKDGIKLKGYGESLFAADRDVNAVRNRFVSMIANHANRLADQPLINYMASNGIRIDGMTNDPGGVINLAMGENKIEPSPMKEIPQTVVGMMEWLSSQVEQGTLPKIPVGTPAPSGTLYNLAQEAGNKVFNPQLRNLNNFYVDACRLVEEQLLAGGIKVEIQGEQKKEYYHYKVTPVDLKKPHIIKVEFTAKTPWTQMDTYQVAQMAQSLGLPEAWIHENILKLQDPKLVQDLLALEIYEHSPEGMMKRAVEVLTDRGYVKEADILVDKMDMMANQEAMESQGAMAQPPPQGGVK